MDGNYLLDLLAVAIGFCGVMLALSLMVTTLVQVVTSTFQIRARQLRIGLAQLLETAAVAREKAEDDAWKEHLKNGEGIDYYETAKQLLEGNGILKCSASRYSLLGRILSRNGRSPGKPTWITRPELKFLLQDRGLSERYIIETMKWFTRMEAGIKQQFLLHTRIYTAAAALAVATLFQVSAPELLRNLSTDPELLAGAVEHGEALLEESPEWDKFMTPYRDLSPAALEAVEQEFPRLEGKIEEASGEGTGRQDILAELRLVLENDPDRETVLRAYEAELTRLETAAREDALVALHAGVDRLSSIQIEPWKEGFAFYLAPQDRAPQVGFLYRVEWKRIIGVLLTAVLLSLGAPFWFDRLKEVVKLRDVLEQHMKQNPRPK